MEQRMWIWVQALAFVLVLTGVSLVLADAMPEYNDAYDKVKIKQNCREYATQCRPEAVNMCLQLVAGDEGCNACSFTAAGYKLNDRRRLGFCVVPAPLEKISGCAYKQPTVQCARLKCYKTIQVSGGVTTCVENEGFCWTMIYWTSNDPNDFCLYSL